MIPVCASRANERQTAHSAPCRRPSGRSLSGRGRLGWGCSKILARCSPWLGFWECVSRDDIVMRHFPHIPVQLSVRHIAGNRTSRLVFFDMGDKLVGTGYPSPPWNGVFCHYGKWKCLGFVHGIEQVIFLISARRSKIGKKESWYFFLISLLLYIFFTSCTLLHHCSVLLRLNFRASV